MSLQRKIEQHWQQPNRALRLGLWPLSRLFGLLARARRYAYASGWLPQHTLACPVVVVGNIHAGGVGKTPITAALVWALRQQGVVVGMVSRGYGRHGGEVVVVEPNSSVAEVGDEPLMLYRQTGIPMAVGSNRHAAAEALLRAHPDTQLIVADDGLQHYALARQMEIVVFPAADVGRALDVLPNGGLREPLARLKSVDVVVISQGSAADAALLRQACALPPSVRVSCSSLAVGTLYRLNDPQHTARAADFAGQPVAALAAIARPQRFFDALQNHGFVLSATHVLPDHATLTAADLPVAPVVVITEKDAVKLKPAADTAHVWVLPVRALIEADLVTWVRQVTDCD